jgi:hypothetical protein
MAGLVGTLLRDVVGRENEYVVLKRLNNVVAVCVCMFHCAAWDILASARVVTHLCDSRQVGHTLDAVAVASAAPLHRSDFPKLCVSIRKKPQMYNC